MKYLMLGKRFASICRNWRTVLAAIFAGFVITSAAQADTLKVLVNHAPQGFYTTLDHIDVDSRILLSRDAWFEPNEAQAWIIFMNGAADLVTLPSLVTEVYGSITNELSTLTRFSVDLADDRSLAIQIMDLSRGDKGIEFRGCLSALDIAMLVYAEDLTNQQNVDKYCGDYER